MTAALLLGAALHCRPAAAQQNGGSGADAPPTAIANTAPSDTDDATAAAVLARYKAATGGAVWDSVRTLDTHLDSISGDTSSGSEEWDNTVDGRSAFFRKNDNSRSLQGYDGKRDWEKDDNDPVIYNDGPAEQQDAVTNAYQISNSFWYTDRMPGKITYAGQATYKRSLYDIVEVQPDNGVMFQMWINHATGLLDIQIQPSAMYTETAFFSKYRSVNVPGAGGSVLIAFQTNFDSGPNESLGLSKTKSVQVNTPTPSGIFDAPTNFKTDYTFRHPGETSTSVPFQFVDHRIEVPIKVNGETENALFDTGASFVLAQYAAGRLRIPVSNGAEAQGNGEHSVQAGFTEPDDMEFGDMKMKTPIFEVIGSQNDAFVPAIIGAELLRRFVVSIDFDTHLMTLTEPSAFHYTGNGIVVPFRIHESHMPIVDGSIDGIPGTFSIDTGDAVGLSLNGQFNLDNHTKDKYQPKFAAAVGYGVGGADYAYVGRANTLTLGGATVKNPIVFLRGGKTGAGADRYESGVVGMPQLHQFNMIFDYADEKMILEPNKMYGDADGYARTGIILDGYTPGKIGQIVPGSPADLAGLKAGDTMRSIDGVKIDDSRASYDKTVSFNYGPVGSSVVIVYKDTHGQTQTATLVLKDVV